MQRINNPMEIFKLLNRSNCRDCHEKTCMAFAVAVFKNKRELHECPHIGSDVLQVYGGKTEKPNTIDEDMAAAVESLRHKIPALDLGAAAKRLGAEFAGEWLTFKVLGKDFRVSKNGDFSTEIHVNPWIAVPLLHYILEGKGRKPSGNWLSFRELGNGMSRFPHFQQRCEKPLKRIADTYPELFKDMLEIFDGKRIDHHTGSDVSIVLHPLPLVPVMICYWYPEEDLESSLHLFFDEASQENLDIDSLHILSEGLVRMFAKIALRHGA